MSASQGLSTRTLFNVFSKLISSITFFIINISASRILGPDTFGETQYLVWFVYTIWTVVSFASPATLTRYTAMNIGPVLTGILKKRAFYLVGLLIPLSTLLSCWFVFPDKLLIAFCMCTAVAGSSLVQAVLEGMFLNKFHFIATSASCLLSLALFYPLVSELQLTGYILSIVLLLGSYTILGIVLIVKKNGRISKKNVFAGVSEKEILQFAFFTWLATIIGAFVWQRMEVFFIQKYLTLKDVAYYSVGYMMVNVFVQFSNVFTSALVPYFAQVNEHDEFIISTKIFFLNVKFIAWVSFVSAWFISFNSPWIISLILGSQYASASGIVSVMIASMPITAIAAVGSVLIRGVGKSRILVISNLIGAVLSVGLYIISIKYYQLVGLVYARILVLILVGTIEAFYIRYSLKYSYPLRELVAMFVASFVVVYSISRCIGIHLFQDLLIVAFLVIVSYSIVTMILDLITFREIKQVVLSRYNN